MGTKGRGSHGRFGQDRLGIKTIKVENTTTRTTTTTTIIITITLYDLVSRNDVEIRIGINNVNRNDRNAMIPGTYVHGIMINSQSFWGEEGCLEPIRSSPIALCRS